MAYVNYSGANQFRPAGPPAMERARNFDIANPIMDMMNKVEQQRTLMKALPYLMGGKNDTEYDRSGRPVETMRAHNPSQDEVVNADLSELNSDAHGGFSANLGDPMIAHKNPVTGNELQPIPYRNPNSWLENYDKGMSVKNSFGNTKANVNKRRVAYKRPDSFYENVPAVEDYTNPNRGKPENLVMDPRKMKRHQTIVDLMSALQKQESSGDYNAINPESGAKGGFQIMPKYWPGWAEKAGLGRGAKMTPENQKKVAYNRLNHYYDKADGDPEKMARVWYGGLDSLNYSDEALARPQHYNGREYPSFNKYTQSVMNLMN